MVLEDTILTQGGRTGAMWQSGAVLFFNIIMVANFRVLVMSYRLSYGLLISVFGSVVLYWVRDPHIGGRQPKGLLLRGVGHRSHILRAPQPIVSADWVEYAYAKYLKLGEGEETDGALSGRLSAQPGLEPAAPVCGVDGVNANGFVSTLYSLTLDHLDAILTTDKNSFIYLAVFTIDGCVLFAIESIINIPLTNGRTTYWPIQQYCTTQQISNI
jgi:hypothetical protein